MASIPGKRKPAGSSGLHGSTGASRKRAKTYDARTLAVQSTEAALSATGDLDVAAYAAARTFEIQALEKGIERSRTALTTRAFQKVPRYLRRRTASHNVKRVPRRLRARAKREMVEDNTPTVTARRRKPSQAMRIRLEAARRLQNLNAKSKWRRREAKIQAGKDIEKSLKGQGSHSFSIAPRIPKVKKNKLSRPPPADAKYRKRQKCKTWLPTHMFHAKRAHMATTKNPLWRFAIPISPTEKSYRPTHRARGSRGAIAWDMSYMSTIQLDGDEQCIEAVLRSIGINDDYAWGLKGKKWRLGTRVLQTWAYEKDTQQRPIAPVLLIWSCHTKLEDIVSSDSTKVHGALRGPRRKLWLRVHPSAFLQLWTDLLDISKRQNPRVMVEDLRFEIGSIEVTGPGSTEALISALRPVLGQNNTAMDPQSPEATWSTLLGVTNPSSLPNNALLSFDISDPRLHFPPQRLEIPSDETYMVNLANLLSQWTPDQTQGPHKIFDRSHRLKSSRQLPSQKAINHRRGEQARKEAGPGKHLAPQQNDPHIPVMIFATRPSSQSKNNAPGSWTVLLPWKSVPPVWYSIMYYPLSSGGNPRFGGLKEQQQLAFEAGQPWFPGDFPGTRAGWEWGQSEAQKAHTEWDRRPKGRRTEYNSLTLGKDRPKGEIGRGWACDWERLITGPPKEDNGDKTTSIETQVLEKEEKPVESHVPPFSIHNLRYQLNNTGRVLANLGKTPPSPSSLATVYVTLCSRGTPTACARIYRLPADNALRQKWIDLSSVPKQGGQKAKNRSSSSVSSEEARRQLAESLISSTAPGDSNPDLLEVPPEEDLIGFITTGNYNLSEGKATGIGSILIHKVLVPDIKQNERRMCIIRASGEKTGRIGIWELV